METRLYRKSHRLGFGLVERAGTVSFNVDASQESNFMKASACRRADEAAQKELDVDLQEPN
jgi:hypothetical protein